MLIFHLLFADEALFFFLIFCKPDERNLDI